MNLSFVIKQDQRGPALEATLTKGDGTPQDLSGGTVTFYLRRRRTNVLKVNGGAVTIVNASQGQVRYSWGASDTDTPGMYLAEFQIANLSPTPVRFPSEGYIVVHVQPKVV